MRHATFSFRGKSYGLLYNAVAMFEIQDEFYQKGDIFEILKNEKEFYDDEGKVLRKEKLLGNLESMKICCRIAEILSIQSANVRAGMGYQRPNVLDAESLCSQLSVMEYMRLKGIVLSAINLGLMQETAGEDDEVDLGLLELQKKTEPEKKSVTS